MTYKIPTFFKAKAPASGNPKYKGLKVTVIKH
jgi:hypothetical protein